MLTGAILSNTASTTVGQNTATIQLTSSATGAFAAVTASTSSSLNGAALAPVTISSGSGTAIFEVTNDDLVNLDSYNVQFSDQRKHGGFLHHSDQALR